MPHSCFVVSYHLERFSVSTDPQTLDQLLARISSHFVGSDLPGLICIDGPAGSGKTTLAAQLGAELPAQIIHMDDLYEGWTGIEQGAQHLEEWVLEPFMSGKPGRYRRYDWEKQAYSERHLVPLADRLVVEGCASATRLVDKYNPFVIWVETDRTTRLRRGLERDGEHLRQEWLTFMDQEERIYRANQTRVRAHLRLNGIGRITD